MAYRSQTKIVFNRYQKIVDGEMKERADELCAKIATDISNSAAVAAPYRYGVLSASIEAARMGSIHYRVNVGAFYGIFQEYGTRYMRAQPFLVPATKFHARAFQMGMAYIFT